MKNFLFLALLVPCLTLAQEPNVQLGKEMYIIAFICHSKDPAVKIADTYATGGRDKITPLIKEYMAVNVCYVNTVTVRIDERIHKATGEHGAMAVYRAVISGHIVYLPIDFVVGLFICPMGAICT